MTEPLTLDGVTLRPGAAPLRHTFEPGRISVVLGRNRSGKTRLTRIIAGLDTAPPGSIRLGDRAIDALAPGPRPVALVYQSFVNYPTLTVADNIASPLSAQRIDRATRRRRVADLARRVGLGELLHRYPAELSGGQQQRLAIARALAKSAAVLVLDEPLVNLDFKLRENLERELRTLLREQGLVVLYTSTDPRDAFNVGDDVLLLGDHELLQAGPPLDVYRNPESLAAADLMSDPAINRCRRGADWCAVRPEHLALAPAGADDLEFRARVLSRETNGSETFLHCEVEGAHWVARVPGLHDLAPGTALSFHAPAHAVYHFPGAADG